MNRFLKTAALLLSITLLTGCTAKAPAETDPPTEIIQPTTGIAGTGTANDPWLVGAEHPEDVMVVLYEDILVVTGSGAMMDFGDMFSAPWAGPLWSATTLNIEEGITYLGDYAFCNGGRNCAEFTVYLPAGLEGIGDHTFEGAYINDSMTVPDTVKTIGACAFADSALFRVDLRSHPEIAPDAFANVTAEVYVRNKENWDEASRQGFGGELRYITTYAFAFRECYGEKDIRGEGTWYLPEGETMELSAEELGAEAGYQFSHYAVVEGSLKLENPEDPFLKTQLREDVAVDIWFEPVE